MKIFYKKYKPGEIFFQEEAANINNHTFLKHNNKGKTHAMMAFHCEMEIKGDEHNAFAVEPDMDWMAQQVPKFGQKFYDQMKFIAGQKLALAKVITKLTESSRDSGFVQNTLH